jgi:triphosphoribosyl-dephospho-CoA synthase
MNLQDIARAAQLAAVLEVSGYPKPGNVHRRADLKGTTFEQFMAGSIAIGPAIQEVAERGFRAGEGEIELSDICLGAAIKRAIDDTMEWQCDGNTNLGVVMLLVPLAAAAGATLAKEGKIRIQKLRKNVSKILESTTTEDALDLYDAISTARPGGMGKIDELDVRDEKSKRRIKEGKISLYEVMKISSGWDSISKELTTGMKITFEFGAPLVKRLYADTNNINITVVQTFLEILSRYPDTFVQRNHGRKVAEEVSKKAAAILRKGGMLTAEGRTLVLEFDYELRKRRINPGTTADLTAASLMLAILGGLRP